MSLIDDSDDEDVSDNDSVFSEDSVEDDSAAARRARRRQYRSKHYRSHGVLSKEWISARDSMKVSDSSAFAKIMLMIRKNKKDEALHGSWGGMTLLHQAAKYGRTNCVKILLLEGASQSRMDGKRNLPQHIARKNNHDSLALIIEFWNSPTTNKRIEGGPNFDYDPQEASRLHEESLIKEKKRLERAKAREKLKEDELAKTGLTLEDASLAKELGVTVVQKGPPKRSKQPARMKKRESLGTLGNTDNKEGIMSEYQKFRSASMAEEEPKPKALTEAPSGGFEVSLDF